MKQRLLSLMRPSGIIQKTALFFVVLVAVIYFASVVFSGWRIDLTDGNLYTLSRGTKTIVKDLKEPVTLTLYYSEDFAKTTPGLAAYAARVKTILQEYARLGHKNIRIRVVDPKPFTEEEDEALSQNIQPLPMENGSSFYFGIAGTNTINGYEVIPFLQSSQEHLLEYELTKMIYRLAHPARIKVGVYTNMPMDGDVWSALQAGASIPESWVSITQVRSLFDVKSLNSLAHDLPSSDLDVLWLAHPAKLSPADYYALDQYVLKGGRVVAFIDPLNEAVIKRTPHQEVSKMTEQQPTPNFSFLGPLEKTWGVKLTPYKVISDRNSAARVNVGGGESPLGVLDYPVWLVMNKNNFNKDEVVTANIGSLNMATVGALEKVEGATTTVTPLIHSTADARLEPIMRVYPYPDYTGLIKEYVPEGKELWAAVHITGPVQTAFASGPPKEVTSTEPQIKESTKPANIIVVGDADMLEDDFWVQTHEMAGRRLFEPFANNSDFLINTIEYLGGNEALISLRSRGISNRPFTLVEKIQRAAEARYLQKEQALQKEMMAIEEKLYNLQSPQAKSGEMPVLTSEQRAAVEDFRQQLAETRKELRKVQADLRRDIDKLRLWLEFFTIGFVPLVVIATPLFYRLSRIKKSKASHDSTKA